MNWYKQATSPIVEFSDYSVHDTDEIDTEFKILLNGKPHTYYGINRKEAKIIRWMINNPKIPGGKVLKKLKPYSNPEMHKKLNPDYTREEQQQMLSELPSQNDLWGKDELV
jgi:hypothetical protein